MRQNIAPHGFDLLRRLPKQALTYALSHPSQVRALVVEKSKPKVAKPQHGVMRLRAVVTAMGFKSATDMAHALLTLDGRKAPHTVRSHKRATHRWSRRKLFPEKRSAIIEDCKAGILSINAMSVKHHVSQATISRIKREEGLVGIKAAAQAVPA